MKHLILLAATLSNFLVFTAHAADAKVVELIVDPPFAWGLRVEDRSKKGSVVTWNAAESRKPSWHVFQADTKSCAGDEDFHSYPAGGFQYRDDFLWLTMHPLGFTIENNLAILEFDNHGQSPPLGVSNGDAFGTWGYDDITWCALQPEWYCNQLPQESAAYLNTDELDSGGKQVYFLQSSCRRMPRKSSDQ